MTPEQAAAELKKLQQDDKKDKKYKFIEGAGRIRGNEWW